MTLVDKYPLEKSKPLKKTISKLFGLIFIFIFFGVFFSVFIGVASLASGSGVNFGIYVFLGFMFLFVLVVILTYIYEVYYLKNYFYDSNAHVLLIKKGVFSKNEITLPFNRIQDVYVDQDILDRIFGLYDVHVSSATSASAFLSHIDGVNKANSEALKELLLKHIHGNQK